MKLFFIKFLSGAFLLISFSACREEFHPLTPPGYPLPTTECQPPSIEQNIVGTWHFESNYNVSNIPRKGVVTFDSKRNINDPDSLFENHLDVGPVLTKTYAPAANSPFSDYPGKLFVVYRTTKGSSSAVYFNVVSNECNKIHISLLHSQNEIGFILTK